MNEPKWIHQDLIIDSPTNRMFRGRLDTEDLILGSVSGKIRRSFYAYY